MRIILTLKLVRSEKKVFTGQLKIKHKYAQQSFENDLKETISPFFEQASCYFSCRHTLQGFPQKTH